MSFAETDDMNIRIKLMGVLRDKIPPDGTLQMQPGATIEDVLRQLDISTTLVQVISVNGQFQRDHSHVLSPDDELLVLPPVAGG